MKRTVNIIGYFILTATIGFHLWLNYPETQILADPNDNIFQYSLVARTNWVWENYGCPFSPGCLPNLTDHNVTAWAEGYPLPFYYSHLPQITTVASYHLLVSPVVTTLSLDFSLYQYYNWIKYLLLCLFPIPVFFALRLVGFSSVSAAVGSFFASNFSTDGYYGIDPPSFLWRGYGLTSQLYAQIFLPLAVAFTYRALRNATMENATMNNGKKINSNSIGSLSIGIWGHFKLFGFQISLDGVLAALFLALTTAGHLGIGIIGFFSTLPFLLFDCKKGNLIRRFRRLLMIYIIAMIPLSYWIIPILLRNNYHMVSFWDPIWKFDSYGWYEVIRQLWSGELFDWKRPATVTMLVLTGLFVVLNSDTLRPFSYLFVFWLILYFGRTTWGGLIDLIPAMKDFHLHRFIVGVQLAGIFLIPATIEWLDSLFKRIFERLVKIFLLVKSVTLVLITPKKTSPLVSPLLEGEGKGEVTKIGITITTYLILFIILSSTAYYTVKQTYDYAYLNNKWIYESNIAYHQDEKNFYDSVNFLRGKPNARIYAGRPGNWGRDFRLGSSQMYMLYGIEGFDMSQFLPETWSPLSENEQNFDERMAEDYDLLNIRYVVADKNHNFSPALKTIAKYGPFEIYEAPTTGWFDIVTSPEFVKTDKTNFLNLVHLWHRSYPRQWKMHPLISVEKNPTIPDGIQRVLTMTDEVNYKENNQQKNIFADYPFVFPEATVSGQVRNEFVQKQTYSAVVEVPQNCTMCFAMFKMSFHPNWQAKVDGKIVEKFAVFPFYLAVAVTPGSHTVEFTYQPSTLKVILIVLELLGSLFLLYYFRKSIMFFIQDFFKKFSTEHN